MNKSIPTKSRFFRRALALLAFAALPSHALFMNGDFGSGTITEGGTITGTTTNGVWPGGDALDGGWIESSDDFYSVVGGEAQRSLHSSVTNEQGLAQFVTDSKSTNGNGYTLSFDWDIVIGTTQSTTYTLKYSLVGTDTSSTGGSGGKITTTNDTLGTGLTQIANGSLTGLGENTSGTATITGLDFGAGFNYVGIRLIGFADGGSGANDNYIAFDNVSVIPEPGTLVLLGISGLALGLVSFRRRRR